MKNVRKVVVFGRSEFAIPGLNRLVEEGVAPELLVVRPSALPEEHVAPGEHPLVSWAKERGVPTVRSRRADDEDLVAKVREAAPDAMIVFDFGRPIPADLRELAKRGSFEVHASLLPKYRGEQPVRTALSNGEKKTGVTAAQLDEEPSIGPILVSEELAIEEQETYGELAPRLAALGAEVMFQALQKIDRAKKPKTRKQNDKSASYSAPWTDRHWKAPWPLEADEVFNRLRAQSPPGLNCYLKLRPVDIVWGIPLGWVQAPFGEEGTYLGMRQGRIAVLCGGSTVFGIEKICRPGDEPQRARDFAKSEKLSVGDRFV